MKKLVIGNIELKNNLILAPMAGICNSPFRLLCKKMGAGLVVAEMVSDKGLFYNNQKTKEILYIEDNERPLSQQIFGSDLKTMVDAAIYIDQNINCDIIDINMGCPVPKVAVKNQAGAALMKNPDLIYEIVSEIVRRVSKPVTVKIRSGWDEKSINAVLVAQMIEKAGASAITVHARTRSQGYTGHADYKIIADVKKNVSIPVIGNGDVIDGVTALKMLEETNCDGIMIGRASLGNPWIFREISHYLETKEILPRPSNDEIKDTLLTHLDELVKLKGEKVAVLEMRGQGVWYLKGLSNSSHARKKISSTKTVDEMTNIINEYFKYLEEKGDYHA